MAEKRTSFQVAGITGHGSPSTRNLRLTFHMQQNKNMSTISTYHIIYIQTGPSIHSVHT